MLKLSTRWIQSHRLVILLTILVFAAVSRFWRLDFPKVYYFDEVYHVVTAKLMALNDPSAYEWWHGPPEPGTAIDWLHPPFAKLTQALFMNLGGFTSESWRTSSALFGVGVIGLTYWLAKKLKLGEPIALLAAFLASLDGLLLVMSRITMNDIHITFFYLLACILYLYWKEKTSVRGAVLTGIAAGLAVGSKWSGIFVLGAIGGDQFFEIAREAFWHKRLSWLPRLKLGLSLLVVVPIVYLLTFTQMWLQGKGWTHFWELNQQIWWYQTNLSATHPYSSVPLQWIFDLRPVYAYTDAPGPGLMRNIYLEGNPLLLWFGAGLVFWTVGIVIGQLVRYWQFVGSAMNLPAKKLASYREKWLKALHQDELPFTPLMFILIGYFASWVVWLHSPRIMFFYHYTPAVPFLCILIAFWLVRWARKSLWFLVLPVLAIAITFVLFYPNWTGIAVPSSWSALYFALPSWR